MNGIVLEVNKGRCLVIDRDGIIHKVYVKGEVAVGESVRIPQNNIRPMFYSAAAAAVLLFVFGISQLYPEVFHIFPDASIVDVAEIDVLVIEDDRLPLAASPEPSASAQRWILPVCAFGAAVIAGGGFCFWKKKLKT